MYLSGIFLNLKLEHKTKNIQNTLKNNDLLIDDGIHKIKF